jgi:nitrogen fixation protein NifB
MNIRQKKNDHPCFNASAKGHCARVHLPVAGTCNIKCNYCNRRYDCVNESRPGVSSAVLDPEQAVEYLGETIKKLPQTTVAGIAGPGDAFADPDNTMETLRLVRERFPHLLLCLATNGLNLPRHVDRLSDLGVTHVTITINTVDPEIGAKIYAWIRPEKKPLRGVKAARFLLDRQLEAIAALKEKRIAVKINTIVIPGVNDLHVTDVANTVGRLGADIHNCMPMFPNKETPFEGIGEPTAEMMAEIRLESGGYVAQMTHCARCRADAAGLLENDRSHELRDCLQACSKTSGKDLSNRPYVAVATMEGALVNQHLGEADRFQIWAEGEDGYIMVQERPAPPRGDGDERWVRLAHTLKDCRAALISGIGERPRKFLTQNDIEPVEMTGFITEGLDAVYKEKATRALKGRGKELTRAGCSGGGEGCG